MSLWSGSTEYLRAPNTRREMWYPAECDPTDELYVWKVKQDVQSGRFFFVNLGGFGKRWKLPDIYDQRVRDELRRFAEKQGNNNLRLPTSKSRGTRASRASHQTPELPALTRGDLPQDSLDMATYTAVHNRLTPAPSNGRREQEQQQQRSDPPTPYPPHPQGGLADDLPQDMVISYGEGDEWASLAPSTHPSQKGASAGGGPISGTSVHSATPSTKEMEQREANRQRQIAEEERMMALMATGGPRSAAAASGGGARTPPPMNGTAVGPLETYSGDPEALHELRQTEALVASTYHDKDVEGKVREMSQQRAAIIFDDQQQKLDERYREDLDDIAETERFQSERIRRETEMVSLSPSRLAGARSRSPPSPNNHSAAGALSPYMSPPPKEHRYLSASPSDHNHVPGVGVDPDTVKLALTQVEHERKTNTRLMRELDEKERLLTEYSVADTEREQRMVQLRMKLMEAMVAHRQKMELLVEEQIGRQRIPGNTTSVPTLTDGGGSRSPSPTRKSGSYIPPHPLMEGDETLGDDGYL